MLWVSRIFIYSVEYWTKRVLCLFETGGQFQKATGRQRRVLFTAFCVLSELFLGDAEAWKVQRDTQCLWKPRADCADTLRSPIDTDLKIMAQTKKAFRFQSADVITEPRPGLGDCGVRPARSFASADLFQRTSGTASATGGDTRFARARTRTDRKVQQFEMRSPNAPRSDYLTV